MNRIFLIGFMGSGKTTIGKVLAKELGWSFIDMDVFIEKKYFKSIAVLFEERGESGFREIEHQAVIELAEFENTVISTGGGSPCFFNNMEMMTSKGLCIYLQLSAQGLANRLHSAKAERPLIKDKSSDELLAYITQTLLVREPFYKKANVLVTCDGKSVEEVKSIITQEIAISH